MRRGRSHVTGNLPTNPELTALPSNQFHCHDDLSLGFGFTGLTRLATNLLAAVTNALATVGLGRTEGPDLRGELSELGLVRRRQHEHGALRIGRNRCRELRGQRNRDRMGKPELKVEGLALRFAAVASADQLERALEALVRRP